MSVGLYYNERESISVHLTHK